MKYILSSIFYFSVVFLFFHSYAQADVNSRAVSYVVYDEGIDNNKKEMIEYVLKKYLILDEGGENNNYIVIKFFNCSYNFCESSFLHKGVVECCYRFDFFSTIKNVDFFIGYSNIFVDVNDCSVLEYCYPAYLMKYDYLFVRDFGYPYIFFSDCVSIDMCEVINEIVSHSDFEIEEYRDLYNKLIHVNNDKNIDRIYSSYSFLIR